MLSNGDVTAAITKQEFLFWISNVLVSKANPAPGDWWCCVLRNLLSQF